MSAPGPPPPHTHRNETTAADCVGATGVADNIAVAAAGLPVMTSWCHCVVRMSVQSAPLAGAALHSTSVCLTGMFAQQQLPECGQQLTLMLRVC